MQIPAPIVKGAGGAAVALQEPNLAPPPGPKNAHSICSASQMLTCVGLHGSEHGKVCVER